jgi:hypothetical protein
VGVAVVGTSSPSVSLPDESSESTASERVELKLRRCKSIGRVLELVSEEEEADFASLRWRLHEVEQVVTSSQQRSHFFRQLNGRPQVTQILTGKFSFFTPLGIWCLLRRDVYNGDASCWTLTWLTPKGGSMRRHEELTRKSAKHRIHTHVSPLY